MMQKTVLFIAVLALSLGSCSNYQKILKSSDTEIKLSKALEFYTNEEYDKAIGLFENILPTIRGTKNAEKVYYYSGMCYFNQSDYILSGYYFRNFTETYPNSEYTEECMYLGAFCHYKESPRPTLDQESTRKAIDALQEFVSKYPNNEKVGECNMLIDELREKMQTKSYVNAKLYFDIGNYKAAVIALKNALSAFPDTKYYEDIAFLMVKANFEYADHSISSKQHERFKEMHKAYYTFIDRFPKSDYLKEAERMFTRSKKRLEELEELGQATE